MMYAPGQTQPNIRSITASDMQYNMIIMPCRERESEEGIHREGEENGITILDNAIIIKIASIVIV